MNSTVLLCIFVSVIIAIILVLKGCSKEKREKYKRANNFHSFRIYNYLVGSSVQVVIENKSGIVVYSSDIIEARGERGVSEEEKKIGFKGGNLLKIYTIVNGNKILYSEIYIDTKEREFIKSLNIGMVSTRFAGSTDSFRYSVTASAAVNGQPWIKIHNLTQQELRLNGHILVPPNSIVRYEGYLNRGIPLGTYFIDDKGVYSKFQYLQPHSDLYYGIVSDLKQSLYGPCQYGDEFTDRIDSGQTLWPLELGYY